MKVKRMEITKNFRRIWLFSANKKQISESFSKQPTRLIVELNSALQHIIVTHGMVKLSVPSISKEVLELGYETFLVKDATRGITSEGMEHALDEMTKGQ